MEPTRGIQSHYFASAPSWVQKLYSKALIVVNLHSHIHKKSLSSFRIRGAAGWLIWTLQCRILCFLQLINKLCFFHHAAHTSRALLLLMAHFLQQEKLNNEQKFFEFLMANLLASRYHRHKKRHICVRIATRKRHVLRIHLRLDLLVH